MAGRRTISKKRRSTPNTKENTGKVRPIFLGTLTALLFTLVAILLFAFVIKVAGLNDNVIAPVNQVIKMAAIAIAALVAVSKAQGSHLFCGAISGVAYILVGFLVFSLIQGSFNFGMELVSDLLMGLIAAAIVSMIVSKFKKKAA